MQRTLGTVVWLVAAACLLPVAQASAADVWRATGSLGVGRSAHTATMLGNGTVLVAGGRTASGPLASAETYDPATGVWTPTDSMAVAREGHTATLLDGPPARRSRPRAGVARLLVAGGASSGQTELYDPVARSWSPTGDVLAAPRAWHTATLLWPYGTVLVPCQTTFALLTTSRRSRSQALRLRQRM